MNQGFQHALTHWALTQNGRAVFEQEKILLDDAVKNLFGYYCVQIGAPTLESVMSESRIQYKVLVASELKEAGGEYSAHCHFVKADLDYLPIAKDSTDVVILPHTLEVAADPYYLLRQVDSMLRPEGHIVITGFNPFGCLVMRFRLFKKTPLFREAQLERLSQIKMWLEVLGYDIQLQRYSTVTCFAQREQKTRRIALLEWVEKQLSKIGLQFGNVYCLVAKKRVDSPTLVGAKWHMPRWRIMPNKRPVSVARHHRSK
ncbi:MAG: class I SAM-dependent methyltransferase [Thiomicrorhabdus sp.]|nr:class I SAM-dependent methyltransferase [Thiomicrorhabdus sp.]